MKKAALIFVLFFITRLGYGQVPGEWVWKSGSSQLNYTGHLGTKGVPDTANAPPGEYEAIEWTDTSGNFWFYGGTGIGGFGNLLWKYDVATNQWTWVMGNPNSPNPVYGIAGVPDSNNTPGTRTESCSWVDKDGNFWLYGGEGWAGRPNDLWKYTVSSNMWTWMKGGAGVSCDGDYGIKGVESPSNNPPCIFEMDITWTDYNGDLWMVDMNGCLWRYRMQTNNWIWTKGNNIPNSKSVYGTKGVASLKNTPGVAPYFNYTRWKDSEGNFWYLETAANYFVRKKILWKYQMYNNTWTWVDGDTIGVVTSNYGIKCQLNNPITQIYDHGECRTCWIDGCDNLWLMGGFYADQFGAKTLNDLVYFDTQNLNWVWVSGDSVQVPVSNFGAKGVSAPTNTPASRSGAVPFKDTLGNLWLYGGVDYTFNKKLADLWMYTPDTNCVKCTKKNNTEGIKRQNPNSQINVFPNPSEGQFNFSGLAKESIVQIYDVRGRLVLETILVSETCVIDLTDNATGMYFYKAIDKNFEVHRGKIILQ